jgi:hypothetical protein
MVLAVRRDEWWLCQEQDCAEPDRASALETEAWIRWQLQNLRAETGKMRLLQDLARHDVFNIPQHLPHDAFVRKIEQLFMSGRLHVHKKQMEAAGGAGVEERNVPFPLQDRQPRIASGPAPIVDVPVFSPHMNMSAQAAALVAAAASGTPFCQE